MNEKTYQTDFGEIHYWINHNPQNNVELIFLPGLTADHKLFNKQIEYFENKYPVFVWDAPGHNNVATSDYGRKLMYDIMMTYDGDKERYSQLVGHGYKIIANAIEANKHYEINAQHYLYVVKKIMQVLVAFTVVFPSNFLLNTNITLSTFNIREYTLCLNIARILGKYPF